MAKYPLGQKVRVIDKESPYEGRVGVIERLYTEDMGFSYVVKFDWIARELLSTSHFREEQLKPS
jgi:hypothetical protein